MWQFEHTENTTATAQQIWTLYADPARWHEWDEGITHVSLEGPFAPGTTGRIKPKGGPSLRFVLAEVTPGKSFTDATTLPLARVRFAHHIAATPTGNAVTQRVWFTGPLAAMFARWMGRSMVADMPATMRRLLQVAESADQASV
ncbi:MAG: SRPBCC family protein [Actinomycetota bacterium]